MYVGFPLSSHTHISFLLVSFVFLQSSKLCVRHHSEYSDVDMVYWTLVERWNSWRKHMWRLWRGQADCFVKEKWYGLFLSQGSWDFKILHKMKSSSFLFPLTKCPWLSWFREILWLPCSYPSIFRKFFFEPLLHLLMRRLRVSPVVRWRGTLNNIRRRPGKRMSRTCCGNIINAMAVDGNLVCIISASYMGGTRNPVALV